MPVLTLIFALFVFLFPKTLEASKAESAIQCAALYLISSSTAHENKELAETFQNLQKMYERIYALAERKRSNIPITITSLSKKKTELTTRLVWKYANDPQSVYAIEMQCNAWRKLIAPYISKKIGLSSNKNFIESAFRSAPNIPKIPNKSDRRWKKSKIMVDKSFVEWEKLSEKARNTYREKIKPSYDDPKYSLLESFKKSSLEHNRKASHQPAYKFSKDAVNLDNLKLRCGILKDCGKLDEEMCSVLNFGPKERIAIVNFNAVSKTIRWEEFYGDKESSAFIKYWKIIVDSESVVGAIEIPSNRRGINSFLLDKETMTIATNMIFASKQNKQIEQSKNLKRLKCEKY